MCACYQTVDVVRHFTDMWAVRLLASLAVLLLITQPATALPIFVEDVREPECEPRNVTVQDGQTYLDIIDDNDVRMSWHEICCHNRLEFLLECVAPKAGQELEVPCSVDDGVMARCYETFLDNSIPDEEEEDTLDELQALNFTRGQAEEIVEMFKDAQLFSAIVDLSAFANSGYDSPLNMTFMEELVAQMADNTYAVRGDCGPGDATLPRWLVGSAINRCCVDHDTCYSTCRTTGVSPATCDNRACSCWQAACGRQFPIRCVKPCRSSAMPRVGSGTRTVTLYAQV